MNKELLSGLEKKLLTYCKKGVFSDVSVAFNGPCLLAAEILTLNCSRLNAVNDKTSEKNVLFDLASLTKPLVTLLSILVLLDEKKISYDEHLDSLLDRKIYGPLKKITLKNLLSHNSGLPAHIEYWRKLNKIEKRERLEKIRDFILSEKIKTREPQKHQYSDLGYILLGFIVEKKSQKKLNEFWQDNIAKPLGIEKKLNFPINLKDDNNLFIKTGICPWSKKVLEGIVHDDNSRVLGGVCGHAGLFGTAGSVLTLCQELLNLLKGRESRLAISPKTFRQASVRIGNSEWTAGFNLPSPTGSSSGNSFSPESIGHLGYTGTSFWIDPVTELIVVLLTNRVIMGSDSTGIKKLRPEIHDYLSEKTNIIKKVPSLL